MNPLCKPAFVRGHDGPMNVTLGPVRGVEELKRELARLGAAVQGRLAATIQRFGLGACRRELSFSFQ
jgi:hypothetical protein